MNTENTQQARGKLEKLTAEQQSYIVWLAARSSQENIVEALKEHGIEVSPATLSRFLKKRRAEEAVEEGKEIAASVEALAEQGRGGKLREGTLEVMRQQFFAKAAGGLGGEEAQVLYGALVAEEARVKELELEARKVAALEQQVRLQERRIEVEAMKARAALGRVKALVVGAKVLKEGDVKEEETVGQLGIGVGIENGTGAAAPSPRPSPSRGEGEATTAPIPGQGSVRIEQLGLDAPAPSPRPNGFPSPPQVSGPASTFADAKGGPSGGEGEAKAAPAQNGRWVEVMRRVLGILNRGGDPGERILEARGLLAEEMKGVSEG